MPQKLGIFPSKSKNLWNKIITDLELFVICYITAHAVEEIVIVTTGVSLILLNFCFYGDFNKYSFQDKFRYSGT